LSQVLRKRWGGGVESLPLLPSWLTLIAPVFEIILACWLLSGRWRFGSFAVATFTFVVFVVINIFQLRAGQTSCGCLGAAKVSPWVTLTLDVIVVLALLLARPKWAGWPTWGPETKTAVLAASVAGVVLAVVVGYSTLRYGSVHAAAAATTGQSIALLDPEAGVGNVPGDEFVEGELRVVNLSDEEVQIAYVSTRCRCADFHDLPLTLPPRSSGRIGFTLLTPNAVGYFRRAGEIRSSAGAVRFDIVGRATSISE
jgi:hypothetical protein